MSKAQPSDAGNERGPSRTEEGFCGLDESWRVTYVNDGWLAAWGGEWEAWVGRPWSAMVGQETADWFTQQWRGRESGGSRGAAMVRDLTREDLPIKANQATETEEDKPCQATNPQPGSLRITVRGRADESGQWQGGGAVVTHQAYGLQNTRRAEEREAFDALILRLTQDLIGAGPGDIGGGFERTLETLGRHAGVDSCFMFEFDMSVRSASMVHEWLASGVWSIRENFAGVSRQSLPTLFPAAAEGQTLWVDDLSEMDGEQARGEQAMLAKLGVGAFLLQPIWSEGRLIGLLGFNQRGRGRVWTRAESELLERAAALCSAALDRRRVQDRLAFHVDNAPLAVIEWDADWRVQRWSPQAERIFGWSADQVMGRGWGEWDFVLAEDRRAVEAAAKRLIDGQDPSNHVTNRNLTADGQTITCQWFNSVMRDQAGVLVSILSFAQDISEEVQVQQRLTSSQIELQRLHTELRERAREAMRESELRYSYLAEAATDLMSCHDLDGHYLYASPAAEALVGYPPENLVGRLAYDLMHPDDVERVKTGHQKMVAGSGPWAVTYRLRHRQNHYLWVETTSRVIDRPAGSLDAPPDDQDAGPAKTAEAAAPAEQQIVAVTRDATSRIEAQRALRDSERRYRQLAEHATDMISTHDQQGRFLYVSPAGHRILGYTNDQLRGTMPREIAHPDDRQRVIDSLTRLQNSTGVIRTTFRARHTDGHYIWLEAASRYDGQELTVVSRDVTDRLHAEQQLHLIRQAVEQVREAVIITDNQLDAPGPHILYVNPAFTAMTGFAPVDILGQNPRILQGPRTNLAVIDRLRRSLRDGQPFFGETTNYRKDRSEYLVEWNVNPVTDNQGRLTHWVAIQRDITARRTAEELARLHRDELAHATRVSAIGEMASGLAHELNQPLAAINAYLRGSLHRIEHGNATTHELIDPLNRAAEQAGRAGQIIRGIREFVTKRGTQRQPQAMHELIAQTLALLEADVAEHLARIEVNLPTHLPLVLADDIQIEQILLNLIRNALEAMARVPVPQRRIEISAHVNPEGQLVTTLRDHGPGLDPQQIDRLFHPFFSTKDEGMGMGLAISQSIAQAHGGRLHAAAHPDSGLIFHLTLPTQSDTNGAPDE